MKVIVDVPEYDIKQMVEASSVAVAGLKEQQRICFTELFTATAAQQVIDRYFHTEYFNEDDLEGFVEDVWIGQLT